jgi:hypothetical protein
MARLVEMVVESVRVHMLTNRHVVILKDAEGDRYLPIWIGPWEASAIAMRLQGVEPERPLTHDLFVDVLAGLDARVSRVVVADLADETYLARLYVDHGGREVEIDARPSDALALAVRTRAAIYAAEDVLDRAALRGTPAEGEEAEEAEAAEGEAEGAPGQAAGRSRRRSGVPRETPGGPSADPRLAMFRDFVNSLGPESGSGESPDRTG